MNRLSEAVHELHRLEDSSRKVRWLNRIHPLPKVIVTFLYILFVLSVGSLGVPGMPGLLGLCIYPLALFYIGRIPVKQAFLRLRYVLFLLVFLGIANPLIDRRVIAVLPIWKIPFTAGMLSMFILLLKGILCILASYLLIMTTSIGNICYALRLLHLPRIFVTLILLISRYLILLLKEAERISLAYRLRAPGQKGIRYKAWASLLGRFLLRSIDRGEEVYGSMSLRGFHGEFYFEEERMEHGSN